MNLKMSDKKPQTSVERIDELIALCETSCPAAYLLEKLRELRALYGYLNDGDCR